MTRSNDGPASPYFTPLPLGRKDSAVALPTSVPLSPAMASAYPSADRGSVVCWGIPFALDERIFLAEGPVFVEVEPVHSRWLIFHHTADLRPLPVGEGKIISPMPGEGRLNEHLANYVICYEDGLEERTQIRSRRQIGTYTHRWGEMCFEAVPDRKPHPIRTAHEQLAPNWGQTQTRVGWEDGGGWMDWLWAWLNPHPEIAIIGLRFEPLAGVTVISGVTAGSVQEHPLRWRTRRKAVLQLPEGVEFQPNLDERGLLAQIQLDLGQVISARPRPDYPNSNWEAGYNNQPPEFGSREILVEYTSHPEACFHLFEGQRLPVSQIEMGGAHPLQPVPPATQRVTLKVVEKGSQRPVAVKLHVHGVAGEYLASLDRQRIVNPAWFEDYSVDYARRSQHECTYISGESVINLPLGKVYIEVSKGYEIRPLRKVIEIEAATEEVVIEVERVLDWRRRGWVTADTHVHFLSPMTALLEGAAEGVNIINLLASQWGELMTNLGDFDGKTTWGSKEAGGEGEYLVRVGSENRQHVLGHISLLGYQGQLIAPMTSGGPDESALGDAVDILLTEWARRCHQQGGLVVLPHFPDPRAEHAASIVCGDVDALEMVSWDYPGTYGISPYSLSDWYRYLNCGYLVPVVGGTDKMSAEMAVGVLRTYAHLRPDQPFTYDVWKEAIRRKETFVTYGPLLDMLVDGQPMGSRIDLPQSGGTLEVTWQAASVAIPMSRVELIVNGEIRESLQVDPRQAAGSWSVRLERSAWIALLVRGQYPGEPEIITAHSSPVMVTVAGSTLMAAADAVTILEQIEGTMAYLSTIATRAEERAYKRMRLVMESAHRTLHNRMHSMGIYHDHDPASSHPEHS